VSLTTKSLRLPVPPVEKWVWLAPTAFNSSSNAATDSLSRTLRLFLLLLSRADTQGSGRNITSLPVSLMGKQVSFKQLTSN
jgi:hypothetical protein